MLVEEVAEETSAASTRVAVEDITVHVQKGLLHFSGGHYDQFLALCLPIALDYSLMQKIPVRHGSFVDPLQVSLMII